MEIYKISVLLFPIYLMILFQPSYFGTQKILNQAQSFAFFSWAFLEIRKAGLRIAGLSDQIALSVSCLYGEATGWDIEVLSADSNFRM